MFVITKINAREVKDHYLDRVRVHKELVDLLATNKFQQYAKLALGISDHAGNYSAAEHALGPQILANSTARDVWRLAKTLQGCSTVKDVVSAIYSANIEYLKIGVGSEMAAMLKPNKFWVGNARTIWTHLVFKHNGNYKKADKELSLYHDNERNSEMDYAIWSDIYLSMESNLNQIANIANKWSEKHGIKPGKRKYLWVDAVCNSLYNEHQ